MKKILLLDIENFHKTEKELIELFKTYAYVYLAYAKSPVAITLDGLQQLSTYIVEKRLVLIKMPTSGPDAADFGLAFLAGQLSVQMLPKDALFDVMSNDKKFIYIVDLLKAMGFSAEQKKKQTVSVKPVAVVSPIVKIAEQPKSTLIKAISFLLKNQPKQVSTLANALKSWMKLNQAQSSEVIKTLIQHLLIQLDANKVSYDLKKMNQFLKQQQANPKENSSASTAMKLPQIEEIRQKPHLQKVKQYCDFLYKYPKGRPAKIAGLLNSLKSILKLEHQQAAQDLIQVLKKQNIISVTNTKIKYQDPNIQAWSKLDSICLSGLSMQNSIIQQPNSSRVS